MRQQYSARSLSIALFLFVFASIANADDLDRLIRERMAERNIPGAAIAVIRNGKPVKVKAYGLASVEFSAPVTADTVFEIGSVSKQMTAAGIMLLVQDGKVSLDEKISKYLPNTPDFWKDVTVRHLLTHTSGIKSYSSLDGFELSRRVTIDGFIKQLSPYPLEFTPGEKNIYSNSGYNLLAYIIQTQSGKSYMDFMRERIFLPLGMTKTADRDPQFVIPLRANGYEWRNGRLAGRDGSLTDLMGAGSIVSTIGDMIKWENALRGDKFLTPQSKREIWTQFTFNGGERSVYGLGWRISDVRGTNLIGHTGQTAGFGAAIFRYIDNDTTVIALTNLGELGMGSMLATLAAKHYLPALSLRSIKDETSVDADLAALIRKAIASRFGNEMDETIFTEPLLRTLKNARSQEVAKRLAKYAPVSEMRFTKREKNDRGETFTVIAKTGTRIFLWRVTVDDDRKIAELILDEEE
jgi:D-alanyl-D-alanine carboxypeptidase